MTTSVGNRHKVGWESVSSCSVSDALEENSEEFSKNQLLSFLATEEKSTFVARGSFGFIHTTDKGCVKVYTRPQASCLKEQDLAVFSIPPHPHILKLEQIIFLHKEAQNLYIISSLTGFLYQEVKSSVR